MTRQITLEFFDKNAPELISTSFIHPILNEAKRTIRGKFAGTYHGYGTFQWTKAVKAISILLLEHRIHTQNNWTHTPPCLSGLKSSLASSLDYALDKQPLWLHDMFGTTFKGEALIKSIIDRNNPGRKRVGPVSISLKGDFAKDFEINVIWDLEKITESRNLITLLEKIRRESLNTDNVIQSKKMAA